MNIELDAIVATDVSDDVLELAAGSAQGRGFGSIQLPVGNTCDGGL
jgi:hypothetical protein